MVLEDLGIDPQRFAIEWVSSAEAPRFAQVVTRFTETVRSLGPASAAGTQQAVG
jgi:F420-non-reducing hydrogenase iron-sulfur subunit